jgi:hypothetical protein
MDKKLEALRNVNLNSKKHIGSLSSIYKVFEGGFGKESDKPIDYFCSAPYDKLNKDLIIFDELVDISGIENWPISKLIQRELDQDRVNTISTGYLRQSQTIRYFPPLTVVLLPISNNKINNYEVGSDFESVRASFIEKLRDQLGSDIESLKDDINEANNFSKIQGLYIFKTFNGNGPTFFAWDKAKLQAIIIDGQHRFASLRKESESNNDLLNWTTDVVFIDIAKHCNAENAPHKVVRKLFVDVNNTPERINRSRLIVMNRNDLAACLVQTIVDEDLSQQRKNSIKPYAIDWHTLNLKHEPPFVTSILLLNQLMTDYVLNSKNLESSDDFRQRKKVEGFVDHINALFEVDKKIDSSLKYQNLGIRKLTDSCADFVNQCDDEISDPLFDIDYRVFDVASDVFLDVYAKIIIDFFNNVLPYKKLLMFLESKGANDVTNVVSRVLISSEKKRKSTGYEQKFTELREEFKSTLEYKKFNLFYTVMGQKALFEYFWNRVIESANVRTAEQLDEVSKKVIEDLNAFFEKTFNWDKDLFDPKLSTNVKKTKVIEKNFWEGICTKNTNIIYNMHGSCALSDVISCFLGSNNGERKIRYATKTITSILKSQDPETSDNKIKETLNKKIEFIDSVLEQINSLK